MANSLFTELKERNVFKVVTGYLLLGWLVLQIADVIVEPLNLPEWTITLLIVIGALGLPFVIFFSWAFEITPEGIKREEEVRAEDSIKSATGQKLNLIVISLLVFSLGYFIWESRFRDDLAPTPSPTLTDKTVAVLPFANFSSDEEQGWFADGLTEEILNSLARIRDLKVSSRTSSFSYKDTTKDLKTIAKELGVSHILEGSVRRSGDMVRVTAQLIRTEDDVHLWSQTYDRDYKDIIFIQEDLAASIANALETAIDPEALSSMLSTGTSSVEAYESYMKGMVAMDSKTAIDALTQAVEKDPDFTRAQSELAINWLASLDIAIVGNEDHILKPEERLKIGFEQIDKAISMTTERSELLFLQAIKARYQVRFRQAINYLKEAHELRPNHPNTLYQLIELYIKTQQYALAQKYVTIAYTNLVRDVIFYQQMIIDHYWTKNSAEAAKIADEATEQITGSALLQYQAVRAYVANGEIEKAKGALDVVMSGELPMHSKRLSQIRYACIQGDIQVALIYKDEALQDPEIDIPAKWLLAHLLDDKDEAYEILKPLDEQKRLVELSSMLYYYYFDLTRYPNLLKVYEEQGFEITQYEPNRIACQIN